MGRKNKYFTHIEPRLNEVAEWCKMGASDDEIADNLQISRSTFYEHLKNYKNFSDTIKKSRRDPVKAIKGALLKRATGFYYTEEKTTYSEKEGKRVEVNKRYCMPDPASCMILLKHWAKDEGWTNDPATLALRKKELEIKEREAW